MSSAEQSIKSVLVRDADHGEEVDQLDDQSGDTNRVRIVVYQGGAKEKKRRDEVNGNERDDLSAWREA